MPNGDPIYYHVHKILETLGLDREAYPDKETISNLEGILHHFLHTDPIHYYVHKILETLGRNASDKETINHLIHFLHTNPIEYYVHKILEAASLDLDAYLDDRIISNLEHILIHLLLTEGARR